MRLIAGGSDWQQICGGGQREADLRLARYIERHQLVSATNDTKWREVVAYLRGIPGFYVEFRVRCVREPLDAVPRRDRSFPEHLPPYKHIEWLDIDPVVRLVGGRGQRQGGGFHRGASRFAQGDSRASIA